MAMVEYQLGQFVAAALFGFFLAFYYEVYGFLVMLVRRRGWLLAVTDFIWWLSAFVLFFGFWYVLLPGEMRLSILLWQFLGFLLFRLFLHGPLLHGRQRLWGQVKEWERPEPLARPAGKLRRAGRRSALVLHKGLDHTASGLWKIATSGQKKCRRWRAKLRPPRKGDQEPPEPPDEFLS